MKKNKIKELQGELINTKEIKKEYIENIVYRLVVNNLLKKNIITESDYRKLIS